MVRNIIVIIVAVLTIFQSIFSIFHVKKGRSLISNIRRIACREEIALHAQRLSSETQYLETLSQFYSFLGVSDQSSYVSNILKLSVSSAVKIIKEKGSLIEISFPESRKSDVSVVETLEINKDFAFQFASSLANNKVAIDDPSDIWLIFPDKKEGILALKNKDQSKILFSVTSIDTLAKQQQQSLPPVLANKVLIFVNPGFNVEEWLAMAKIYEKAPSAIVIAINGNLDRLRNNYYPPFFYPALAAATKSFFARFSPALFLSPVAVNGDRLGAWICTASSSPASSTGAEAAGSPPWVLLVRSPKSATSSRSYSVASIFDSEPQPNVLWKEAKQAHFDTWGKRF